MKINKEVVTTVLTEDNQELHIGDTVIFNSEERCFAGKYLGITRRGSVSFEGLVGDTKVIFNVMPRCITSAYRADVAFVAESEAGE